MNTGTFAGRLGRDAETKMLDGGNSVTEFSLGVSIVKKGSKDTLWVKCALWGERGEKLCDYLRKGKAVTVSGDISVNAYQTKGGELRGEILCNVQRLTLQSSREDGSEPAPAKAAPQKASEKPVQDEFNDDIPF